MQLPSEVIETCLKINPSPPPPDSAEWMHVFYSQKAFDSGTDTVCYRLDNGMLVAVTGAYTTREHGEQRYNWDDKVYLGRGYYVSPGTTSHSLMKEDR